MKEVTMDLLINSAVDAAYNLALEEIVAAEYPNAAIMLWRNANAIIVGRNQNTAAEINADFVRIRDIQVIRRMTGGGAVYHDLGNINYTIIAKGRQLEYEAFSRNAGIIVQVLNSMGVAAEFHGRNDILVDGRKISGSAKCVLSDRTLFHGTLLFDADLSVLGEALTPDESKIQAKGIKSVRSRVANLKEFLPQWDVEQFLQELQKRLSDIYGGREFQAVPDVFCEQGEALANKKYRTWDWNFGTAMNYSYYQKARFACGGVEVAFNVHNNRIADLNISGDFFGSRPAAELAEKLNGSIPRYDDIAAKLAVIEIGDYISGLSTAEFLTLFRLN